MEETSIGNQNGQVLNTTETAGERRYGSDKELYRQIGRLKVEVDFLKKRWAYLSNVNHFSPRDIVSHINRTERVVPLEIQSDLLRISRFSLYYQPKPVDPETFAVINSIDELYTKRPFYGSRKIAKELGYNRKRIQRLMRLMGIEAIYQKLNLSKNDLSHPVISVFAQRSNSRISQSYLGNRYYVCQDAQRISLFNSLP